MDGLRSRAAAMGLDLPPQAARDLIRFEELLRGEALPRGFVSASDAPRLLERHILDSLRAVRAVEPEDRSSVDLGSGAGLPGLVLALALPGLDVRLVEPMRRRAGFLELVVERLGIRNARVLVGRAEDLGRLVAAGAEPAADLCTARALGPLERCAALARPILRPGGRLVWFAGAGWSAGALPAGARVLVPGGLESGGPLVIMARQ
ncbi:MAG TPA: 16S rRNA (guanine(527)-N(7))-methyltransferase RsmG [Actinomycetota bacterium]|nr:16S rRNA (guanine(527)-N(7))-methyltransferase RsmG [Actinomycetota bacterium]